MKLNIVFIFLLCFCSDSVNLIKLKNQSTIKTEMTTDSERSLRSNKECKYPEINAGYPFMPFYQQPFYQQPITH